MHLFSNEHFAASPADEKNARRGAFEHSANMTRKRRDF
jgi:hypothetical protein